MFSTFNAIALALARVSTFCVDDVTVAESQVRDLDAIVEKLNTTFQEELKDEVEAFNFFLQ